MSLLSVHGLKLLCLYKTSGIFYVLLLLIYKRCLLAGIICEQTFLHFSWCNKKAAVDYTGWEQSALNRCSVQPLMRVRIPDAVFVQLFLLRMGIQGPKHVKDSSVTYMLLMNCALKLVEEIILYYDAESKKHQITWDE